MKPRFSLQNTAAPSFLWPGTIAENCARLATTVPEVGLLFFETRSCLEYTDDDLPLSLAELGLRYHVHLPLDLPWAEGAEAVLETVHKLLAKCAFLQPWAAVLHPPLTVNLFSRPVHPVLVDSKLPHRPRTIKPLRNENKKLCQDAWQRLDERCLARSDSRSCQNGVNQPQYFRRLDENKFTLHPPLGLVCPKKENRVVTTLALEHLRRFLTLWVREKPTAKLLLENIQGNDLTAAWPLIRSFSAGICLDLGHLLAFGQETDKLPGLWPHVGLVHLSAPGPAGEHLSLRFLDQQGRERLCSILTQVEPDCVLMPEVFNSEDFLDSLAALREWGMLCR
jgi:hypothetical protein